MNKGALQIIAEFVLQFSPTKLQIHSFKKVKNVNNLFEFTFSDPIPSAHLQRHLTPVLETYLCSICAKGGVAFKIHFLSLPAVVQVDKINQFNN